MLLEFKMKNYKSFVEETVFSLTAAPKQSGLDYSLLVKKAKGKTVKGLCSSVIYGPNAAGKTTLIGAMDVFRAIVLRGNIKNSEEKVSPNTASYQLELIPNDKLTSPKPVEFTVQFYEKDYLIDYKVSMDLGCFLDEKYERNILEETLSVNGELVFERKEDSLEIGRLQAIKQHLHEAVRKNPEPLQEIAKMSLNEQELFLNNGFKVIYSQEFSKCITDWFLKKFMVVYCADAIELIKRFETSDNHTVYVEKTVDEAAKLFGVTSNAVGYVVSDENPEGKLCSIIKNMKSGKDGAIAAEVFESYGTIRFINIFPLVIRALREGGTLIVDEFDASIHPMALMSIINVFHNDDINVNHAQLVFNTHNPIFLNSNLFRRDEIKFVERDEVNHGSVLYSLSDFGTSGEKGVRKHEDYMKNYFVSRYGAIKTIDFSPIFEEMLAHEGEI